MSREDESRPVGEPWSPTTAAAGAPPSSPPPYWPGLVPPPRPAGPGRARRVVAGVLAVALLLFGSGATIGWALAHAGRLGIVASPIAAPHGPAARGGGALDVQQIAGKVSPAVVDINTVSTSFGRSSRAAGTGMIVSSSGEVLTNNHVIQGATSIRAEVAGGGSYTVKVIGADPSADIALVQLVGASGLPTVTLAGASHLSLGETVVAIGNALGQGGSPTVTSGTITGLDRSITASDGGNAEQLSGMVQTDAPISPGDSGGPLVDTSGQVVGMITAGSTQGLAQSSSTVGFAIPSTRASTIVSEIENGSSDPNLVLGEPGFLGVGVQDLDQATALRLGLNVSSGALVVEVEPGSPADDAGIGADTVITSIDGHAMTSASSLSPVLHHDKPGQQVRVTWVAQDGTHSATVTLASGPAA